MTRKYPLESVQRLRADRADDQARALAEALRAVDASGEAARRRLEAQQRHARARAEVLVCEQQRLERGELRASDLADRQAWTAMADQEQAELARVRDAAAQALTAARRQAEETRKQLQVAHAEAKAIDRHRDAFRATQERAMEAREEEQSEEVHLARRAREGTP